MGLNVVSIKVCMKKIDALSQWLVCLLLRSVYARLKEIGCKCNYWADPILQPDLFKKVQMGRTGAFAKLDDIRFTVAYYIYIKGGALQLCREALALLISSRRGIFTNLFSKFRAPKEVNRAVSGIVEPRAVLVVGPNLPNAESSAGDLAIIGLLLNLQQLGFSSVFVPLTMADKTDATSFSQQYGVHVPCAQDGYRNAEDFVARTGKDFATFFIIGRESAQSVLSMCRIVAPSARIIFHAPDVAFLREERAANVVSGVDAKMVADFNKRIELSLMQQSDLVMTVSNEDAKVLQHAGLSVPVAIHQALNVPVRENTPGFDVRKDMFFLGNFDHKPNIDGILWCCQKIWPSILEQMPDVRLHIIGSHGEILERDLSHVKGVFFHGFVPDLEPLLLSMRLCLAPLRYGAGIKGKVAMSLGAGIPCVCTSIAAEGMLLVNNETVSIADNSSDFVDAAIRLYSDKVLWSKLAMLGKEHVQKHFTLEANKNSLCHLLKEFKDYSWLTQ